MVKFGVLLVLLAACGGGGGGAGPSHSSASVECVIQSFTDLVTVQCGKPDPRLPSGVKAAITFGSSDVCDETHVPASTCAQGSACVAELIQGGAIQHYPGVCP